MRDKRHLKNAIRISYILTIKIKIRYHIQNYIKRKQTEIPKTKKKIALFENFKYLLSDTFELI